MLKVYDAALSGVKILEFKEFSDDRGVFGKYFCADWLREIGICDEFRESYFSKSKKGAIRGMHFQAPPKDHSKLVCVLSGKALDVCVDIRRGSPSYGKFFSIELSENEPKALYIPTGFAHGIKALADDTCLYSLQSTCYDAMAESGIRYDSFGFDWGESLIVSQKDKDQTPLNELISPFSWANKGVK